MYYVTYRNVLRPSKTLDDYRKGLQHVWPTLQSWGALGVEMYQELYEESGSFYTRYTIDSLDRWNRHVTSDEFNEMLEHLEHVLDLSMSEVSVAVSISTGVDS